jgi:hypothetical protein
MFNVAMKATIAWTLAAKVKKRMGITLHEKDSNDFATKF